MVRDWSLITGRGGGGSFKRGWVGGGEGAREVLKGGEKSFSHAERGGHQQVLG